MDLVHEKNSVGLSSSDHTDNTSGSDSVSHETESHPVSGPQHIAEISRPHPYGTHLQDGTRRPLTHTDGTVRYPIPKAYATQLRTSQDEPTYYSNVVKFPEWRAAMADEFNALLKHQTWTLVPPSSSQNTVGCKWVFKLKRHSDGSVERHKARLVAKGFHQQPGFDYDETFSPVVRPATIRTVVSLATSFSWPLRQLDVKNVFLQGYLSEPVYMTQPPGFIDPKYPHHVCRLHKAIYGLKQAPRAWFTRLSSFLLQCGF
ncbi:Retrovirus-related pol polyprotein from transposon tnt 1-94 [Thalictrum thalictroides]|uniref:Retrovirus-related pol polyprotein from transposon tnt 1-94 n=1 Tax=Thalictrum thalictroides TaxID=46969 RepID=A0A7J6WPL1_THATH|nr:Retrovirus-related pol polyprotein from transposon tnt 1-94 [Thalictrum thalictroides]